MVAQCFKSDRVCLILRFSSSQYDISNYATQLQGFMDAIRMKLAG